MITRPLSKPELDSLEEQVGLPMPSELREYYSSVGLFQDLTSYGSSEYEVHERAEDLTLSRKSLVENFGREAARFFPFAGDGAGNEIAVAEVEGKLKLFFADHETLKITELGFFSEWVGGVLDAALQRREPANSEKKWGVQFSFKTPHPEAILEILRQFAPAKLGGWSKEKAMPSGVYTSAAPLTFGERELTLGKTDLRHPWGSPMFSFDFDEPATMPPSESLIRRLDIAFRGSDLGYKLVDYGPIALGYATDEEDAEKKKTRSESEPGKRAWWKFW